MSKIIIMRRVKGRQWPRSEGWTNFLEGRWRASAGGNLSKKSLGSSLALVFQLPLTLESV